MGDPQVPEQQNPLEASTVLNPLPAQSSARSHERHLR